MISRSNELTRDSARELVFNFLARASFVRLAILAGAFLFLATINHAAFSAPISYPGHIGTTVIYSGVQEDTNSGDTLPLFGAPIYSGDSIDFNPVGFDANATGAGGVDITDGNLAFIVTAKPGNAIANISLSEAGDTTMAGFGNNSTLTSVTASGIIDVYEIDGVGINNISVPFSLTFNPQGGFFGLGNNGGGPVFHTQWSGSTLINVSQILVNAGKSFLLGATKVSLNLDNTLVALSQAGTQSSIAKKDFGGLSITVNEPGPGGGEIPEPAAGVLAALAILGVASARRSSR